MPSKIVHFELPAKDTARAVKFYRELFGWEFDTSYTPIEYHMPKGIQPGGGIYPAQGNERGPIVYFEAEDIDKTIAQIRKLGGTSDDKMPIPTVGWFSVGKDPEGNDLRLFQNDPSVPAPTEKTETTVEA